MKVKSPDVVSDLEVFKEYFEFMVKKPLEWLKVLPNLATIISFLIFLSVASAGALIKVDHKIIFIAITISSIPLTVCLTFSPLMFQLYIFSKHKMSVRDYLDGGALQKVIGESNV